MTDEGHLARGVSKAKIGQAIWGAGDAAGSGRGNSWGKNV